MVAIASPIANESDNLTDFKSSLLSISCASKYSSGAMNSTMNSSGSSVTFGKNGNCDASAPNAICTSGVETLGMKRLRNEDSTTAAIIHTINSNAANVPPFCAFSSISSSLPRGIYGRVSSFASRERNRIVAGMQWSDDMELAIELAREAAAEGEVPVGAVVLDAGGAVIGSGRNLREAHADPLAHAEVKAMDAGRSVAWYVESCRLHVDCYLGAVPDVRRRVPANACRTNRVRRVGCQVGCMRFDLGHSSRPACRSCSGSYRRRS